MLKALAEARALNAAGDSSDELRTLVRHARDMHDLLLENLIAAEPGTAQYARGLADSMGNHLDDLERLLEPEALQGAGARGAGKFPLDFTTLGSRSDSLTQSCKSRPLHVRNAVRAHRDRTPASVWRPFCSERCKMIDLGAWASERYRVPVAEPPEDTGDRPG